MRHTGSNQARKPAGIPAGGQFAATNRPEATGIELVDDERDGLRPGATGGIRDALLYMESAGAMRLDAYEHLGRVAAALPACARAIVADHIGNGGKIDSLDTALAPWADLAMRRAIAVSSSEDAPVAAVFDIADKDFRTTLERAARYHVRQALSVEHEGDTSWVCPANPEHPTLDGRCVVCGASQLANSSGVEQVPPQDAPEDGSAPLDRSDGGTTRDHVASSVPTKAGGTARRGAVGPP